MSIKEQDVVPGGPSQEEAKELNRPKPVQGVALNSRVERAVNVAAALAAAAGGVGLAATADEALRNVPPPQVRESTLPQPKPPEGVVFPESEPFGYAQGKRADAPVEPVLKNRIFLPNVTKEAMVRYHLPRIGNLKEDGITINHAGTLMTPEVGFELVDYELYKQTLGRLAKVCRPNGIEWFIYNARSGNTLDPEPALYYLDWRRGYESYVTYLAAGGGFFQTSTLLIGRRPDGVTEVHWGLFLKPGAQPTAEDLYNQSWGLITNKINGYTSSDNNNPDEASEECRTTKRAVFELLYERARNKQPFPIQLTIK